MGSQTGIMQKFRVNFTSFREVWLFIQIFFLVTLSPVALRLFSIPRLMRICTPRYLQVYEDRNRENLRAKAVKFTDYILGWNALRCRNTCLKRALVLYYFLRKWGMDVRVCFGVRYAAHKRLDGHAWLLYQGDIFLERNTERTKAYTQTYCFPDTMEQIKQNYHHG